nr:diguanylate cyclase [uncultured Lichenicoccus sp.]
MLSPDFAARALEAAGIGGWELDLATRSLRWTAITFAIHELQPDRQPDVEAAIRFYRADAQPVIRAAVVDAIESGACWDLELPFITARGRSIWVRACGCAQRESGRTVRLTGTFQDVTARHELADQTERLSMVVRQMTNAVVITGPDGRTEWINDAFVHLTGYSLTNMLGRVPGQVLQGPDTDPETVRHIRCCLAAGRGFEVEVVNYTAAGQPYWIAVTCTPLRDGFGRLTGFIAVETDVTARRQAEDAAFREAQVRERTEALLHDVLDALPSAVTAYDTEDRLILTNKAFKEMFPISAGFAIAGRTLEDLVRLGVAHGQYPDAGTTADEQEAFAAGYLELQRHASGPRSLRLPDNRFVLACERRSDTGYLVCVRSDTTELMRAEAKLRAQAQRDPLTGLANRAAFVDAMRSSLEPGLELQPVAGALMLFDVDHFKSINDTLGHGAGDAVLVEIAARLRSSIRGRDLAVRLGGDEFVVIMPGLTETTTATARIDAIQAQLALPMLISGQTLSITSSAGVTLFPRDGRDPDALLKAADLALYDSKRNGRGRWCFFHTSHTETAELHGIGCAGLRSALARGGINVSFQPRRLLGGGHSGFGAQARWHDGRKWVVSTDFVPTTGDAGLVIELVRASLAASLGHLRALRQRGLEPGPVALKIGGIQLMRTTFVNDTLEMLRRHGLTPADLELEVPVSVVQDGPSAAIKAVFSQIRASGLSLVLEGLGHGPIPLAAIFELPVDRITVGGSLVAGIASPGPGRRLVRSLLSIAAEMEVSTLAEHVGTLEQWSFLKAHGCAAAWGNMVHPPLLTLDEMEVYLAAVAGETIRAPVAIVC